MKVSSRSNSSITFPQIELSQKSGEDKVRKEIMSGLSDLDIDIILDQTEEDHDCESFPDRDSHDDYGPAIFDIVRVEET